MDPAGDPFMKDSLKRTRGKINMGGIAFPVAFTAQATVTSSPLSADVTEPTCFFPFSVTICLGVCTVVTPVSSMLYIMCGGKLYMKLDYGGGYVCKCQFCYSGQKTL